MAAEAAVTGYARALLTAAEAEGVGERVEDELFRIARNVEASAQLREQLANPGASVEQKLAVIDELLAGRAHPHTVAALLYIVQAGRGRQLVDIADEFVRQAAESRRRALAEVRTAVDLDDAQRRRLKDALEAATDREVELRVVVDPDVVGGVVATVGDTVIDGTVARRLAELRSRLTGA